MANSFEAALQVSGWDSKLPSIQQLLNHLARKTKSEPSRLGYLTVINRFALAVGLSPEELVKKTPDEASELVQNFIDTMRRNGRSSKNINTVANNLVTFFKVNGFKKGKEIEIEKVHVPARYRSKPEYIPTKEEVWRMADTCGSTLAGMRDKAIILTFFSTGFRNGALRAIRYSDVKEQLESGEKWILVNVYPEMKQVVPEACKGNIPYYSFLFPESVSSIKQFLTLRRERMGEIEDGDPVFCSLEKAQSRGVGKGFISKTQIAKAVKSAARRAGIQKWKDVYPHCLRKSFESVTRETRVDGSRLGVKEAEFFMGHILPGVGDTYFDKTKTDYMRREFQLLNFSREVKGIKKLQDSLDQKDVEIKELKERQKLTEDLLLTALVKGEIQSMPLSLLERVGYSIVKNPDGTFTLMKKQ